MSQPSWIPDPGPDDQVIAETWLFRLHRRRFRSVQTGHAHDYYITDLADGVHVIAVTPDDEVVMVRQFRAGSGLDSLETPGGLLDPGEDPGDAGARELLEETGYAGDPPVRMGVLRPNPALLSMAISTVVITEARPVSAPRPDIGEELSIVRVPAREVAGMIRDGRIDHAVCVAGLLLWLSDRDREAHR